MHSVSLFFLSNETHDIVVARHNHQVCSVLASSKSLTFTVDCEDEMPNTWLWGDSTKITRILVNICTNAILYTTNGSVKLSIKGGRNSKNKPDNAEGSCRLHFSVEDTGPGMTRQQLLSVMEPYARGSSREAQTDGTGLGLPIARSSHLFPCMVLLRF